MLVPLIAILGPPCAMMIAATLLASVPEHADDTSSEHRFRRQVRQYLEPQIRPKGRRTFARNIAVLPRFAAMHVRERPD